MKADTVYKSSFERTKCNCGNLTERVGTTKSGYPLWGKTCRTCRGRYRYSIQKKDHCEQCGFVAVVSAQLEIDHADGNNDNNDRSNLRTLCCNCHALKSYRAQDIRFPAENNPFFGKRHSAEALSKIKAARAEQDRKKYVV
jgi:hypothetical protein